MFGQVNKGGDAVGSLSRRPLVKTSLIFIPRIMCHEQSDAGNMMYPIAVKDGMRRNWV